MRDNGGKMTEEGQRGLDRDLEDVSRWINLQYEMK